MSKHHTQRSREEQIQHVEQMIIKYGGWTAIVNKNKRLFTYLVARELACTFSKAREYIELATNAAIARKVFENGQE